MPPMLANQRTYFRAMPQAFPVYVFVHKPAVVFAARVNQTTAAYPAKQVTYDTVTTGAHTAIEEDMTILFGSAAGLDDLGRVRVRKNASGVVATSSVLYFNRASQGNLDGEVILQDNAYITVLDMRTVSAVPPYIADDGTIYKDTDIAFNASRHLPPVANAGPDMLRIVNSPSDTVSHTFGVVTPSYRTHPSATSGVSYSWSFPGCTPSSSTSATPTVTIPHGVRYVRLTVTDSMGTSSTAVALIAVRTRDDEDMLQQFDISSHIERQNGQTLSVALYNDLPYSEYPVGTELLMCTDEHADQEGPAGYAHMLFAGWVEDEDNSSSASARGVQGRSALTCIDAAGRLAKLPCFPLTMRRKGTPTAWDEVAGSNCDRYVWYMLYWHSSAMRRVDFTWSGLNDAYGFTIYESTQGTLWQQAELMAAACAHVLTCDCYGRIRLVIDSMLYPTTAQNAALPVGFMRQNIEQIDLFDADIQDWQQRYQKSPRVHWNWGEALQASVADYSANFQPTPYFVVAPGKAPGQGGSQANSGAQIVRNLNELRWREGNRYRAKMNSFESLMQLTLKSGRKAIHPADVEWVQVNISADFAGPRGRTKVAQRMLPVEVSYRYGIGQGTRTTTVTLEQEVVGWAAEPYTPARFSSSDYVPPNFLPDIPIYPVLPLPPAPGPQSLPRNLWLLGKDEVGGYTVIARATSIDLVSGAITFTNVNNNVVTGVGFWGCSDPWDWRRVFVLTSTGLWKTDNMWATTPTWSLVKNNAGILGDAARMGQKVGMSINRQGFIGISSGQNMFARSFDYGDSWSVSKVNSAADSYGNLNYNAASFGIYKLSWMMAEHRAGHIFACQQENNLTGNVMLHISKNYGATWSSSVLRNFTNFANPWIYIPYTRYNGAKNLVGTGTTNTEIYHGGETVLRRTLVSDTSVGASVDITPDAGGLYYPRSAREVQGLHIDSTSGTKIAHTQARTTAGATQSRQVTGQIAADGTVNWENFHVFTDGSGTLSVNGFSTLNQDWLLTFARDTGGTSFNGDAGTLIYSMDHGVTNTGIAINSVVTGSRVAYAEASPFGVS
jgi:hypothetical protein